MPTAAAGAVFAAAGGTAVGATTATLAVAGTLSALTFVGVSAAVSIGLSYAAEALTGKPRAPNPSAQDVTVNDSLAPRMLIYGQTRVSGVVGYFETSRGTSSVEKYLWYVVPIAGHQCEEISDIWLDSDVIPANTIDDSTGRVTSGKYKDKVYVWKKLGRSDQTALPALVSAFPSVWDSNHRGQGVSYIALRLELDATAFPSGQPQNLYAIVKGRRVYDPRKDSTNGGSGSHRVDNPSTWEWSANPALCKADYLTGGCICYDLTSIPDRLRTGMKEGAARINWAQVAAAANECDESVQVLSSILPRYTCNGVLSLDATHSENMARLNSSDAGAVVFSGGKYRIFAGGYDLPVHTFTDRDLGGAYSVSTAGDPGSLYNAVSGIFVDPATQYQQTTCAVRTDAIYEAQDGEQLLHSIDLPMTNDEYRAQRLSEIDKRRTRNQTTVSLSFGVNGLKIAPWETFNLALEEMPQISGVYRCVSTEITFTPNIQITITGKREDPSVYTDLDPVSGYILVGSAPPLTVGVPTPAPIRNLRTYSAAGGIMVEWDPPEVSFPGEVFEVWNAANISIPSGLLKTTSDTQYLVLPTSSSATAFAVRTKYSGQYSSFVPPVDGGASGVSGTPGTIGSSIALSLSSQALQGFSLTSTTVTSDPVTATASGGTGPYTYAWNYLSGAISVLCDSPLGAVTTFTAQGMTYDGVSAVYRCTAHDSVGGVATMDVTIWLYRLVPQPYY